MTQDVTPECLSRKKRLIHPHIQLAQKATINLVAEGSSRLSSSTTTIIIRPITTRMIIMLHRITRKPPPTT